MLRTVYLYGVLGDKFGKEPFQIDADKMSVLLSGINSYHKGFKEEFRKHGDYYIIKSVDGKKESLTEQELPLSFGNTDEIHLVPSAEGSGLEIAALITGVAAGFATAAAVGTLALGILINIGITFALSALANSLAGSPDGGGTGRPEDHQSALFTRAENVVEQGGPVPLVYGEFRTGSTVISTGITTEDVAV